MVKTPDANLSRFAQRLNTAYALYARYRHKKPGHIFQGRFKARLVENSGYLTRVSRYIHLNPVRTKAATALSDSERLELLRGYRWSSYRGYVRARDGESFMQSTAVLREFGGGSNAWSGARRAYRRYVEFCVSRSDEETIDLMKGSPYVIGSEQFAFGIEEELAERRHGASIDADLRLPRRRLSLEAIDSAVCAHFAVAPSVLKGHGRASGGKAEAVAVELACLLTSQTQRPIGEWYGDISCSAVGAIRTKMRGNPTLSKAVADIGRDIQSARM